MVIVLRVVGLYFYDSRRFRLYFMREIILLLRQKEDPKVWHRLWDIGPLYECKYYMYVSESRVDLLVCLVDWLVSCGDYNEMQTNDGI